MGFTDFLHGGIFSGPETTLKTCVSASSIVSWSNRPDWTTNSHEKSNLKVEAFEHGSRLSTRKVAAPAVSGVTILMADSHMSAGH